MKGIALEIAFMLLATCAFGVERLATERFVLKRQKIEREAMTNTVNRVKDLRYDRTLGVTWTNVVDNGHIYYIAVTNTNISAAQ